MCLKDSYGLKAKEWRKVNHANTNQKEDATPILISDEVDFRIIRDDE